MKLATRLVYVSLALFLLTTTAHANNTKFGVIHVGASIPVVDSEAGYSTGFNASLAGLVPLNTKLHLGIKIAYNRFPADDRALSIAARTISGSIAVFEAVPSVRITPTAGLPASADFFMQAGFGLFRKTTNIEIEDGFLSANVSETTTKPGLSIGVGYSPRRIGSARFEIAPEFSLIFSEGETTKYVKLDLGILLSLGDS